MAAALRTLWPVLCCLALCRGALGFDRERTLAEFLHTVWTANEGAPLEIWAITQTSDGYLWLAAQQGLIRFDGVHFESYQPQRGQLASQQLSTLFATPDGGLWIGFRLGGAAFLKDGQITNYGAKEGLPSATIYRFALDSGHTLWAATSAGLERLSGTSWRHVGGDWGYRANSANGVFVDRDGALWAFSSEALFCLRPGTRSFKEILTTRAREATRGLSGICQTNDGRIWVSHHERGIFSVPDAANLTRTRTAVEPSMKVIVGPRELLVDGDGGMWIVKYGGGVSRIPNPSSLKSTQVGWTEETVEHFDQRDQLTDNTVFSAFEDREGNVWFGTQKGLDRFRRRNVVPSTLLGHKTRPALLADKDGTIWAAGYDSAQLVRLKDGRVSQIPGAPKITAAYCDPAGVVWFGGQALLMRFANGGLHPVKRPAAIRPDTLAEVQAITSDHSGGLWISVIRYGIFRLQDNSWVPFGGRPELPKGPAITLWTDAQGRVWFGYPGDRLAVLDGDKVEVFSSADGLHIGNVSAITSRNGRVWLGGESGLAISQSGHIQMLATLAADSIGAISGIVEEPNGDLWLNQSTGIVHISADQIREKLTHHDRPLGHEIFDVRDGVLGVATQLRPIPSAVQGHDGRIWFSGSEGVTWIDPKHIFRNTVAPPVSIRSVTVNGQPYNFAQSLHLSALASNVQIDYAALSLSIPERVRFRYRLEGYEKDWQEAGGRRSAFYNRLGPGDYGFHVIASNNDGVWNTTGAMLTFTVPPTYYQTLWFRGLCVAAGFGVLWLLYLMRLRQVAAAMQGKFEERLKERTRIAQELHDTLLQGFLSASMFAQVANEQLPPDSQARATMSRAIDSMRQVIEEGRNAVRGLRPSNKSLDLEQSLLRVEHEIGSFGEGGSEAAAFRVVVQGGERELHPLLRDELYRIGQEALINAFRHAKAKTVEAHLDYSHSKLQMVIRDDGCGIDPEVLQSGRDGHWGLSGMRERADRIGAHLHIETSCAGTEISISVPGSIAFVDHGREKRGWLEKLRGSRYGTTDAGKPAI